MLLRLAECLGVWAVQPCQFQCVQIHSLRARSNCGSALVTVKVPTSYPADGMETCPSMSWPTMTAKRHQSM
eukprot:1326951-Amphidinium_carterae.1